MLNGKVAVVTGAAQGLGRVFCLELAGAGASVVAADINLAGARETAEEACAAGGKALALAVDVTSPEQTERMAAAAAEAFGRLDILVNNAAVYYGLQRRPFHQIDPAEWDRVLAVNVKGPWLCARAVFPHMQRGGGGKIVNVASEVFFTGSHHLAHYVASKGGVVGLTRALARELGDYGICVNAVAPGFTATEASQALRPDWQNYDVSRNCLKRLGEPGDVAGVVLFLCSRASDFLSGQTIIVDGGRHMA